MYILYYMLTLTSKMTLGITLGRRPFVCVPLIFAGFHTPHTHCCVLCILRPLVPVAHMLMLHVFMSRRHEMKYRAACVSGSYFKLTIDEVFRDFTVLNAIHMAESVTDV